MKAEEDASFKTVDSTVKNNKSKPSCGSNDSGAKAKCKAHGKGPRKAPPKEPQPPRQSATAPTSKPINDVGLGGVQAGALDLKKVETAGPSPGQAAPETDEEDRALHISWPGSSIDRFDTSRIPAPVSLGRHRVPIYQAPTGHDIVEYLDGHTMSGPSHDSSYVLRSRTPSLKDFRQAGEKSEAPKANHVVEPSTTEPSAFQAPGILMETPQRPSLGSSFTARQPGSRYAYFAHKYGLEPFPEPALGERTAEPQHGGASAGETDDRDDRLARFANLYARPGESKGPQMKW